MEMGGEKTKYPESDNKLNTIGKRKKNWINNGKKLELFNQVLIKLFTI
jgi:hypothetical protein